MRISRSIFLFATGLLLFSACNRNVTVEKDEGSKVVQMVMKEGKVLTDPVHGKEVAFWYGAVSGVGDTPANGVGYTHKFEDGVFISTLNLNVKMLEGKSQKYFAWLLSTDAAKQPVKMEELTSVIGDVRHSARLETKTDLTTYTKVVVTLETTGNPSKPGKHIAEGDLKQVEDR